MPRRNYQNDAPALTLDSSITNSATTIPVTEDISSVEVPLAYTIDPGGANEEYVVLVDKNTGTTPNQFENCVRGFDNSAAVSHSGGEALQHEMLEDDLDLAAQMGAITPKWGGRAAMPMVSTSSATAQFTQGRILCGPIVLSHKQFSALEIAASTAGSSDGTTKVALLKDNNETLPTQDDVVHEFAQIVADAAGIYTLNDSIDLPSRGLYWCALLDYGYSTPPEWHCHDQWGNSFLGIANFKITGWLSGTGSIRWLHVASPNTDHTDFSSFSTSNGASPYAPKFQLEPA